MCSSDLERFDLILSNPPYIPTADICELASEIKFHEPHLALDGGLDGLDAIRQLLDHARSRLLPGGRILIEMGFDQQEGVASIATSFSEYEIPEFVKDLAGHPRLVHIKKYDEKMN